MTGGKILKSSRRHFLKESAAALGTLALFAPARLSAGEAPRALSFHNLNSDERLDVVYFAGGKYDRQAFAQIKWLFRDLRNNELHDVDPKLLDLLHDLKRTTGSDTPFRTMSGYRSPATNALLAAQDKDVDPFSLHMEGRAVDVIQDFENLEGLWGAARTLKGGGVGYYPHAGYIHLDTGPIRHWRACSEGGKIPESGDAKAISGCFSAPKISTARFTQSGLKAGL